MIEFRTAIRSSLLEIKQNSDSSTASASYIAGMADDIHQRTVESDSLVLQGNQEKLKKSKAKSIALTTI